MARSSNPQVSNESNSTVVPGVGAKGIGQTFSMMNGLKQKDLLVPLAWTQRSEPVHCALETHSSHTFLSWKVNDVHTNFLGSHTFPAQTVGSIIGKHSTQVPSLHVGVSGRKEQPTLSEQGTQVPWSQTE